MGAGTCEAMEDDPLSGRYRPLGGVSQPPLWTCEAVLSEAFFLLSQTPGGGAALLEMMRRRLVRVSFSLEGEIEPVARLLTRYASVPMTLADACLVRMSELHSEAVVLTTDQDFRVYRRHGAKSFPRRCPSGQRTRPGGLGFFCAPCDPRAAHGGGDEGSEVGEARGDEPARGAGRRARPRARAAPPARGPRSSGSP